MERRNDVRVDKVAADVEGVIMGKDTEVGIDGSESVFGIEMVKGLHLMVHTTERLCADVAAVRLEVCTKELDSLLGRGDASLGIVDLETEIAEQEYDNARNERAKIFAR